MVINIKRVLNKMGVPYVVYIDDFGFKGNPSYEDTKQKRDMVLHTLTTKFGVVFGTKKCPLPARQGDFLGFEFNTQEGWWRVSRSRVLKAKRWLQQWDQTGKVTKRSLAKFCGYVASTLVIFPRGRFYIKHHLKLMSSVDECWEFSFSNICPNMKDQVLADSRQWIAVVENEWCRLWVTPTKSIWLSTDATLYQAAAVLWQGLPEFLPSTTHPKLLRVATTANLPKDFEDIVYKEMFAIYFGLDVFRDNLLNTDLFLAVDNQTAFYSLLSGYSPREKVQYWITKIYDLLTELQVKWNIEWIPSKINMSADTFSRWWNPDIEWELNQTYFLEFLQWCRDHKKEEPTIDAFATAKNKKLPQFCSRFEEQGQDALGNFFFVADQIKEHCLYLNPPFTLITKVLQYMRWFRLRGWILLPTWPLKQWWQVTHQAKEVYSFPCRAHNMFINDGKTRSSHWECKMYLLNM